jgi:hydrogenase nickel incorporation protein HypA/HybF
VHELSIASAVVATVEKHAEGRPVSVVTMTTGALRQVVPASLAFYFEIVARGTVCEGARLEQRLMEAQLRCAGCGHEWEPDVPTFRCPGCTGANVEIVHGAELEVESIEIEEAECLAPR